MIKSVSPQNFLTLAIRLAFACAATGALAPATSAQATAWRGEANTGHYWNESYYWTNGVPGYGIGDAYNYGLKGKIWVSNNGVGYGARAYYAHSASLYNYGKLDILGGGIEFVDVNQIGASFAAVYSTATTTVQGGTLLLDYGNVYALQGALMSLSVDSVTNRNAGFIYSSGAGSRLTLTSPSIANGGFNSSGGATTVAAFDGGTTTIRDAGQFHNFDYAELNANGSGSTLVVNPEAGAGNFLNENGAKISAIYGGVLRLNLDTLVSQSGASLGSSYNSSLTVKANRIQLGSDAGSADADASEGALLSLWSPSTTISAGSTLGSTSGSVVLNDTSLGQSDRLEVVNHGRVIAQSDGAVSIAGSYVSNDGEIDVLSTGSRVSLTGLALNGRTPSIVNSGSVTVLAGAFKVDGATAGLFQNAYLASVSVSGKNSAAEVSVPMQNDGFISVAAGKFDLSGSGASLDNDGSIYLRQGGSLNGAAAQFMNGGQISIETGSTLRVDAGQAYMTRGSLSIDATSSATFHDLQLSSGTLTVKGTLNAGSVDLYFPGTVLTGNGTINGSVHNHSGLIAPGDPNVLSIDGDLINDGLIHLIVDGAVGPGKVGGYDQLSIGGQAFLGGTLDLDFGSGYVPTVGDTFDLIHAASISGNFASITTNLPSGYAFRFGSNGVGSIQAVPEPTSFAALGAVALVLLRRRRR